MSHTELRKTSYIAQGTAPVRAVFPDIHQLNQLEAEPILATVPVMVPADGDWDTSARPITRFLLSLATQGHKPFYNKDGRWLPPAARTVALAADDLRSFLAYCNFVGVDWRSIEGGDLTKTASVRGWGQAMLTGRASKKVKEVGEFASPISVNTVLRRLNVVQDFLDWACKQGYRRPYIPILFKFHNQKIEKPLFNFPGSNLVDNWLERVNNTKGRHLYLMIRLMLECGVRRSEVTNCPASLFAGMRVDGAPGDRFPIRIDGFTKGGKQRTIYVPSTLATALQAWLRGKNGRRAMVERLEGLHRRQAPDLLFFNPDTGKAFSERYLNTQFKSLKPWPAQKWTPHMCRHYFACRRLLAAVQRQIDLSAVMGAVHLGGALETIISTELVSLQEELGHSQADTTERYTRWVRVQIVEALQWKQ